MADELYQADVVAWSDQQAALLRRAAHGERVNGLDWPNLIEEIEDVGRAELHAVESLLGQALLRLLKVTGWPGCDAVPHWQAEAIGFLGGAVRRFAPSMRPRIDLAGLFDDAVRQVRADRIDGAPPRPLPAINPLTLDDLLCRQPDIPALLQRLAATV